MNNNKPLLERCVYTVTVYGEGGSIGPYYLWTSLLQTSLLQDTKYKTVFLSDWSFT